MQIDNLRIERTGEYARVLARVTWEDRDRPRSEVYFATLPEYADALSTKADVFLPAFALLAAWYREARLRTEGSVCPILLEGIITNLRTLHSFEGWNRQPPSIEAEFDLNVRSRPPERAAAFFSCGLDSLFTLHRNHTLVPQDHPCFIRDVIHVRGAGFPEDPKVSLSSQSLNQTLGQFATITEQSGVNLIPILSNLREAAAADSPFFPRFWDDHFHKAAIASVAHALMNRLTRVFVPSGPLHWEESSGILSNMPHNYSSCSIHILHFAAFLRLEKTEIVSNWEPALHNMLVCTKQADSNCGRCLKCLLTRTCLAAIGRLEGCGAFAGNDLAASELSRVKLITPSHFERDFQELVEPLRERGREDLVAAVQQILDFAASWDRSREDLVGDVSSAVPSGAAIVLVDDAALQLESLPGERPVIPLVERDGRYWGSPAGDREAIEELERLRAVGAEYLAVAWPSAWWFDTYPRWNAYLRERFPCILENPRVTVFNLRHAAERSTAA